MTVPDLETDVVRDAQDIARQAITEMHADRLTARAAEDPHVLKTLSNAERVFGIAVGKAGHEMIAGLHRSVPPNRWCGGLVVGPAKVTPTILHGVEVHTGGHPVPSAASVRAGQAIARFIAKATLGPQDIVAACISGGTSAMVSSPRPGVRAADLVRASRELLMSGLDVTQINTLRARLSTFHGGGLPVLIEPAACVALLLCDNVQVGAPAVGSGPTFPPPPAELIEAILTHINSPPLRARLLHAARQAKPLPSTEVRNVVVAEPRNLASAAHRFAKAKGYSVIDLGSAIQGEARETAIALAARCRAEAARGRDVCLVGAGEVTVTVRGRGRGGRCQELALAVSLLIEGLGRTSFVAQASDGRDYIDDAAGAWVTGATRPLASRRGIDLEAALRDNASHEVHRALGQLIPGGPSGTNLCDLYLFCIRRS